MVFISMIYKFQLLVFVFRPVDFKVISWNGFFFFALSCFRLLDFCLQCLL